MVAMVLLGTLLEPPRFSLQCPADRSLADRSHTGASVGIFYPNQTLTHTLRGNRFNGLEELFSPLKRAVHPVWGAVGKGPQWCSMQHTFIEHPLGAKLW